MDFEHFLVSKNVMCFTEYLKRVVGLGNIFKFSMETGTHEVIIGLTVR